MVAVAITPEIDAVLRRATTDGSLLTLPGQLDRALYSRVDKALRALGARWNKRAGGHVISGDAGAAIAAALAAGKAVDAPRTAGQFFTPPAVAAEVFAAAELERSHHVLEPSAGDGALLAEPLRLGCLVTAVEQDEALIPALALAIDGHGGGVWHADFLSWTPIARRPIDRVLMNPPFARGSDMAHVARAFGFLRFGGVLVAVMTPHWRFAENTKAGAFRELVEAYAGEWRPLPDNSFRAAGTAVSTGLLRLRQKVR